MYLANLVYKLVGIYEDRIPDWIIEKKIQSLFKVFDLPKKCIIPDEITYTKINVLKWLSTYERT